MKRLLLPGLGVLTLVVTGCAISGYAFALLSLPSKEVLQQGIPCPTPVKQRARNVQILSTHKWQRGVVVLYGGVCTTEGRYPNLQRVFGHQVVKRDGMNWQIAGSGSFTTTDPNILRKDQLIDYRLSKSLQPTDRYALLYGQVLSPKVTAVEATFDNGQIVRNDIDNGMFSLVAPAATGVCQVRVLGNGNQILKQEDLVMPKLLRRGKQLRQCLPVSRQL